MHEKNEKDELTHFIIEFYDKLSSWEHDIVASSGLTLPQMHTLEVIGYYEYSSMKPVAEKLGITMGTLTTMIRTLTEKKLVTKQRNDNDSRSFRIVLTKKGKKLYEDHHQFHHELVLQMLDEVNKKDVRIFKKVLGLFLGKF